MAVTTFWYAPAFVQAFDKEIDFLADDIAVTLHTSSYTPDQDSHDYFDDLTNQLSTSNGYTAEDGSGSGKLLASKANSNSANVVSWDSADPSWTATGAGFTARILVLSDVTSNTASTDPLLLWSNFGQDETASGGGTFTYAVNASGWATLTVADAS
jgi:hypothetical protein